MDERKHADEARTWMAQVDEPGTVAGRIVEHLGETYVRREKAAKL
jgi:hypothetical protein